MASPVLIRPQLPPQRNVAGFIADAVLEENAEDDLVITDHPVEQGASIQDNAYKLPAVVTLIYVWAAGSSQNVTHSTSFLKDLYQAFLQLQVTRTFFTIVTGKRVYNNMLLKSIGQLTDRTSENILQLRLTCQEIIFTTTQLVQISNAAVQALPNKNSPIVNQGNTNLVPGTNFNSNSGIPAPAGNP